MGRLLENSWEWVLSWRRELFVWDESCRLNFFKSNDDRWVWEVDNSGVYTLKSAYHDFLSSQVGYSLVNSEVEEKVFKNLWKSCGPNKVLVFSLQMFLDKIPIRANLSHEVISLGGDTSCVLCGQCVDTAGY